MRKNNDVLFTGFQLFYFIFYVTLLDELYRISRRIIEYRNCSEICNSLLCYIHGKYISTLFTCTRIKWKFDFLEDRVYQSITLSPFIFRCIRPHVLLSLYPIVPRKFIGTLKWFRVLPI